MKLQPTLAETRCVRLAACAFGVADWQWPFALEHAEAIARDWQLRQSRIPQLFNGTVYLLRDHSIDGDTLRGTFFKTDFRTFLYWREHRCTETEAVRESFGASLVRCAEGHVLLGRQGPGQLHSGRIYPPGGLIDGEDVREGGIDINANIVRELAEETGLGPANMQRAPGYIVTFVGLQVAIAVEWHSALSAAALRARMLAFIRRQAEPELDDIVIVRERAGIDESTMPPHAQAVLRTLLPA
jgi:8-oxo-dGTP pyrophosphatase MutT (NUDIX family)